MEKIPNEYGIYDEGDEREYVFHCIKKELDQQRQEYIRRTYELIEQITSLEGPLPSAFEDYINLCTTEKRFIDLEHFSKHDQLIGQPSADTALAVHRTALTAVEISRLIYSRFFPAARDLRKNRLSALEKPDGHIPKNIQFTLYTYLDDINIPQ